MSKLGLQAALGVGLLACAGISLTVHTMMNYTRTEAVVTAVETDCFVRGYKRELVEADTQNKAYMACDLAPLAAKEFGYSASDARTRHRVSYRFTSPVDRQTYDGQFHNESTNDTYKVGEVYRILAHKKEADSSQWGMAGKPVPVSQQTAVHQPTKTAGAVNGLRGKL